MASLEQARGELVGTIIESTSGRRAMITDIGETGVALRVRGGDRPVLLPLRELRAGVRLWRDLRTCPSEQQVIASGVPEMRAIYLAPLLQVLRRAPAAMEWLTRR